jgi:hypothetical protein
MCQLKKKDLYSFLPTAQGLVGKGGPHLPAPNKIMIDFCLCGAVSNLKAFCFGAISDIMIELITYWSVYNTLQLQNHILNYMCQLKKKTYILSCQLVSRLAIYKIHQYDFKS